MTTRYVLGIDAGQTTVKAVLHDEQLRPVAIGRRSSPLNTSVPRQADRSQDELWSVAAGAIRDALEQSGIDPTSIAAIGVAGHGDGLHLVDAAGAPVGMAITAVDSRAHVEADQILADPERRRIILERSGQLPVASSPGVLLKWMVDHEPELMRRAHAMLSCKDIIRLRLTGEIATEISDACSSFLDAAAAPAEVRWSREVLEAYGLGEWEHLLPQIRLGGDIGGSVTAEAAALTGLAEGTPVIMGLHDVQAASIGMSALIPGRLALVAGSFSTNGVTTTARDVDARWQSRLSVRPDLRIAMSTSPTASPTLEWMLRLLGVNTPEDRDALFAEAAALDPNEHVPLVLPYLFASPLGAEASGTIADVRGWHTSAHLLRGTLEGIVLMHVWHTSALAEKFQWETGAEAAAVLGGGLSNSALYVQLVANALRQPIQVISNEEAGAFGVAALAAVSAGLIPSLEQAQTLVQRQPAVEPTAASADYWKRVIASFNALGTTLAPWWHAQNAPRGDN